MSRLLFSEFLGSSKPHVRYPRSRFTRGPSVLSQTNSFREQRMLRKLQHQHFGLFLWTIFMHMFILKSIWRNCPKTLSVFFFISRFVHMLLVAVWLFIFPTVLPFDVVIGFIFFFYPKKSLPNYRISFKFFRFFFRWIWCEIKCGENPRETGIFLKMNHLKRTKFRKFLEFCDGNFPIFNKKSRITCNFSGRRKEGIWQVFQCWKSRLLFFSFFYIFSKNFENFETWIFLKMNMAIIISWFPIEIQGWRLISQVDEKSPQVFQCWKWIFFFSFFVKFWKFWKLNFFSWILRW